MDKIIRDEFIFDDESPFTCFAVEKFVYNETHRTYFFSEWIRHDRNPDNSLIILTANDGTDDFAQVKILKSENGYYLAMSKRSL